MDGLNFKRYWTIWIRSLTYINAVITLNTMLGAKPYYYAYKPNNRKSISTFESLMEMMRYNNLGN
jgi:hypothetical protein